MKVTEARAHPLWWAQLWWVQSVVGTGVVGAECGTGTQKLDLSLKLKSWEPKGWVGSVVLSPLTSEFQRKGLRISQPGNVSV